MPLCIPASCRFLLSVSVLCIAVLVLLAPVQAQAQTTASAGDFPQTHSDLTPDPSVLYGSLDNGIRYCLMANDQPRDKVSMRLLVESGSLLETQEQRGLAHFLEHMAFNGTTHYPHGSLVSVLQGLGLAFGADTNAHTSFDETVYKLDLPDAKAATIATGLQVFADYAGGMLLQQKEIDRERGVILAEMRDRDSPSLREWLAIYAAIYPGLIMAERFPIGTKATVEHADSALLQDYYGHWYRPERMVLSVAGAIDVHSVAAQLAPLFSPIAARDPLRAPPPLGTLQPDGFDASYHRESEATGTTVQLSLVAWRPRPHDSLALQHTYLLNGVGDGVLNRRLRDIIARHPDGALIQASSETYQWMDLWHAQVRAIVRPGMSIAAVAILEQELRRLRQFGPTSAELAVAVAEQKAALDQAVAQAGTRTNANLTDMLYDSVHQDQVFLSPTQNRDLYKPMLEQLTAQQVQDAAQVAWSQGHLALVVTGSDDLGADATTQLQAAYLASQKEAVEAPVQRKALPWGYAQVPEPGHWRVEPSQSKTLDFWPGELDNGVAVRVKRTDFQPNEVMVLVRIDVPPPVDEQPGLREFAAHAFIAGGLGKHSATELSDVLAGSTVVVHGLAFDESGIDLVASCQPQELELCCQELRAYLTDPGWRSDGEATAKAMWLERLASISTNLDEQVRRTFENAAVAGAPARRSATLQEAQAVNFTVLRPWLMPMLHDNPLTVSVVGDVQASTAMDLITTYFGSLPERKHVAVIQATDIESALAICPALPNTNIRIAVPGTVARALIQVAWPTADYYDIARTRRLGLLAGVITECMRVRIRQELGDAYSPHANRVASEAYRDYGYVMAEVGVAPSKATEGTATLLSIAQELADKGVSDDLLARVKTPIIKSLAAQLQMNRYWLFNVLGRSASQPFRLAWAESLVHDYNAITAADISALAKQYLNNAKTLQVVGVCTGEANK